MKKRIALIDHSYRKKTSAIDFLKDLLRTEFEIIELYDDSWMNEKTITAAEINQVNAVAVLFFQILPPAQTLKQIDCQNIIWFPMYDAEYHKPMHAYLPYTCLKIKIVAFSQRMYDRFRRMRFDVTFYKYQLKPKTQINKGGGLKIFFWARTKDITWNFLKHLLADTVVERIILRIQMDPGQSFITPSKMDQQKYSMTIIDQWLPKSDYLSLVAASSLYIAPRKREGIGLSFIEALSLGVSVLAIDDATMNEYIADGKNGYLLNPFKPRKIDFERLKYMEMDVRAIATADYENWERTKNGIISDIMRPTKPIDIHFKAIATWNIYDLLSKMKRVYVSRKQNWLTSYDETT